MGAQRLDPKGTTYDPDAFGDEWPVRRVELSPFFIGRYLVTVFEYDRFIAAGAYVKRSSGRPANTESLSRPDIGGASFGIRTAR
jgi:formylglycine-generating enzyme required for sulfatase activity